MRNDWPNDDPSVARPRWLIYALGGGMGHLMRSLALARGAARRGIAVRVLSNSPFAPIIAKRLRNSLLSIPDGIEIVCIRSAAQKDEVTQEVAQAIQAAGSLAAFVVDTFPRGLAGELVELLGGVDTTKVWVQRDLNPEYVRWGNVESIAQQYDLIFSPGEDGPLAVLPHAVKTAPWLICDAQEMLPLSPSRAALGIHADDSSFLAVVSGCGKTEEALQAAKTACVLANRVAGRGRVRFVSCDDDAVAFAGEVGCSLWPLMPALSGVDLLLGSGGYNTIYESRAAGVRLLAVPQSRLYDRQHYRILANEVAESWESSLELACEHFATGKKLCREAPMAFFNGVHEAVSAILEKTGGP